MSLKDFGPSTNTYKSETSAKSFLAKLSIASLTFSGRLYANNAIGLIKVSPTLQMLDQIYLACMRLAVKLSSWN